MLSKERNSQLEDSRGRPHDFKLRLTPCWLETWKVDAVLNSEIMAQELETASSHSGNSKRPGEWKLNSWCRKYVRKGE